jgi:DNA-3-methyladenine glycosylase I
MPSPKSVVRCAWPGDDALMTAYHDTEWSVPLHDDAKLFEFLFLDTMQAGLSWKTVLHKRDNYRRLFDKFDAKKISKYTDAKLAKLLLDPGIIRNRLKVKGAVTNARKFLEVQKEFGTFAAYVWQFTMGKVVRNRWAHERQVPATSPASDAMAADLRKRGFVFCGTTICYAFMQAAGMVNDHMVGCFRYKQVGK